MITVLKSGWRILLVQCFLLSLIAQTPLFAQGEIRVTGTVISQDDNEPLPGVNIILKGTKTGTITDFEGNYTIMCNPKSILEFRFIGYGEKEEFVGTRTKIDVTMSSEVSELNEVVVVGYGTQKKSHLTGAISKVKNEKLDQLPTARIDDALAGQVSGVNIQMTNPEAGAAPTIQVRGVGSIGAGSSPAIVVDGVLVDSDYMAALDMNDVASIEVLKDASSAAIFGSRGGNGVIMITTKSGASGETKYTFNSFFGQKWVQKRADFRPTVAQNKANAEAYLADMDANRDDYIATGKFQSLDHFNTVYGKAQTTISRMDHMLDISQGNERDWQDEIFTGGNIQSYSLSAAGGSDNTTYHISGAYLNDQGVLLQDEYTKMNLRFKLKTKLNKKLELGVNFNPTREHKQVFPTSLHESLRQSSWLPIVHDAHSIQYVDRENFPNIAIGDYTQESHFNNFEVINEDGTVTTLPNVSVTNNSNPYANIMERDYQENTTRVYASTYLKYKIMKGLNFRSSLMANYRNRIRDYYTGTKATRNGEADARLQYRTYEDFRWVNDNYFTYDRSIKGGHDINAVVGMSFERGMYETTETIGTGFTNDAVRTMNAAGTIAYGDQIKTVETLHSVFSRFNYAYMDKYLVSFSMRTDGSSKFGQNYQYGIFPAGSFGWRMTEESFMRPLNWVSVLKPRISYGITGNNSINDYEALERMSPVGAVVGGNISSGYAPANIAMPDLRWEKQIEINPGIDYGFLGNRIYGSFEWYRRTASDLLLSQQIPSVTGFDQRIVNLGRVQNQGFEIELSGKPVQTEKIKWTITANLSTNENKLVNNGGVDSLTTIVDDKRAANWIAIQGMPISTFYGFKVDRTKGDNGNVPLEYLNEGFWPIGASSQRAYVQDLNGDGVIDDKDRTVLGSPYPTILWAVTNSFNIGRFDFMFMFQGSHGGLVRNIDPQYYEYQTMQGQRPNEAYMSAEDIATTQERIFTDDIIQDASFIALRSLNIGYTLPTSVVNRIGLNSARVYCSGSNLIYLMADNYTSFNPEGIRDEGPLNYGYQRGASPMPRSFTVGINVEF
ncbi:TonB-dependent receptor [Persicobacter psychrovividus]|uniref:SusC/RagA family TonB-linked outer membrane protein n=1 Tax=Persicobacter psychrovividus TaxID=387638 RepID=A0ABM7VJ17_9BACT|nr:SusC/RagA family TonB-linked outer membrane protein [Persicobacter psychrovividus]